MRASIFFAASVLPVLCFAQDSGDAKDFLDSVDICAQSTLQIEAAKNSCGLDIACLCKDDSFITTIMAETTCTPPQLIEFGQLVAKECSSYGVTVDIPSGDSGNSDSGDSDSDKSDTGSTDDKDDDKDDDAEEKTNWGGRTTILDLGMMLAAAGLAGLVGV
ncbi:hypothetical protein V496_10098 [Pseudogymnoascus sp. VKM F-4515 (FW-2607)]|nr:hypothetical protein V496_10098 [Pseudogymnoascus sp. VKM F-4515 (FW-2607)]